MRRRVRFLHRARELAYRDLGGLIFEMHRMGQRRDELVQAKLGTLRQIDTELRALEAALGERQDLTVLREAGVAACSRCAAIHSSEDRFCPNCGLAMGRHADRPIAGPAPAGASAGAPPASTAAAVSPAGQAALAPPASAPAPPAASLFAPPPTAQATTTDGRSMAPANPTNPAAAPAATPAPPPPRVTPAPPAASPEAPLAAPPAQPTATPAPARPPSPGRGPTPGPTPGQAPGRAPTPPAADSDERPTEIIRPPAGGGGAT